MKRFIWLLNVVLALSLLVAACAPPTPIVVVEKEVPVTVEKEVVVEKEVEKVVEEEEVVVKETYKLNVLTQNIQCLPKAFWTTLAAERVAAEPRARGFVDIFQVFDIVGLQEAWYGNASWEDREPLEIIVRGWYSRKIPEDKRTFKNLDECLRDQRRNIRQGSSVEIVYGQHFLMGPYQPGKDEGGGLIILTGEQYPIIGADAILFSKSTGWDSHVQKGCLYARVRIGEDEHVHVFNTHLQAHNKEEDINVRKKQIEELKNFVDKIANDDHPVIFMGDFNVNRYQDKVGSSVINDLEKDLINPLQLEDAWPKMRPDKQPDYTWVGYDYQPKQNENCPFGKKNMLATEKGDPQTQILDYIFHRHGLRGPGSGVSIEPSFVTLVPSSASKTPYCLEWVIDIDNPLFTIDETWGEHNRVRGALNSLLDSEFRMQYPKALDKYLKYEDEPILELLRRQFDEYRGHFRAANPDTELATWQKNLTIYDNATIGYRGAGWSHWYIDSRERIHIAPVTGIDISSGTKSKKLRVCRGRLVQREPNDCRESSAYTLSDHLGLCTGFTVTVVTHFSDSGGSSP